MTCDLDPQLRVADALGEIAPLSIYAAAPRGPFAITGLSSAADGAALTVRRVDTSNSAQTYVSALTLDGAALATAEADFAAGEAEAIARFDVPAAALAVASALYSRCLGCGQIA